MAQNEYGEKLDSNGYAPSVLHDKPTCLICGRFGVARHEVYFGPYRDKSKQLGLWVTLCPWCHQNGNTAVHTNRAADLRLKSGHRKRPWNTTAGRRRGSSKSSGGLTYERKLPDYRH